MTYLLPPLNALRAFEAAARHLSFKQAAHELHVTAGAISQQVRLLEERLGVQLFERRTRQVILTSAGEPYLAQVRQAFRCLAEATAELKPEGVTSMLHIGLHASFAVEGLRTRLAKIRRVHPQLAIRISQPAGLHELLEGKVDVVIADRVQRCPGYRCEPLARGFLIGPLGTAECPEIETLRSCLLGDVALAHAAASRAPLLPASQGRAP
ncbi:LysR family transcriptional regulator [Bradyrhizobium sp. U531]|uniref:LysR family transcriptional regulator n=1 Tax=Bradyrhizobium sp. U531 TaxID=3053458 RepID=UPI003F42B91C